jgi:D-alanyl-lipoteichoic acid acyltransferase DltB (MBOAT superfamily)
MLFNSYEFIFLFLPVTIITYFWLNRMQWTIAAKRWLLICSLFFYSWWNVIYLPLLLGSIIINFAIGSALSSNREAGSTAVYLPRKYILVFGIVSNLGLLGYFKYAGFLVSNINHIAGTQFVLLAITLPLGISFFTFTQITFLVDAYERKVQDYEFLNYALFVTFFPHLIAGPIIHHKEMMPQFSSSQTKVLNYKNLSLGIFLFFIGLFKKVGIADTLSLWANSGFDSAVTLTFFESWITSLSFTFQIYFDFSGYTDMALGAALMFNIRLPVNFNSPYKVLNVQEFWRKWHITLSRFLRGYVYIPMGGNRLRECRTYQNLMLTFLIGGLWHGASWMFVIWGGLHGLALVTNRLWQKTGLRMHSAIAWFITFNFINVTWILFRAKDWKDALKVLKGLFGMSGIVLPQFLLGLKFLKLDELSRFGVKFGGWIINVDPGTGGGRNYDSIMMIALAFIICITMKNSNQLVQKFKPTLCYGIFTVLLMIYGTLSLSKLTQFLYFNF